MGRWKRMKKRVKNNKFFITVIIIALLILGIVILLIFSERVSTGDSFSLAPKWRIMKCIDGDKDGWNSTSSCNYNGKVDCNNSNNSINPGALEICDKVDNNCNGVVDENVCVVQVNSTFVVSGDRMIGIDMNIANNSNFDNSFSKAYSVGINFTQLSFNWKDIETSPGVYQDPWSLIASANAYYSATGTKVALVISPIDTSQDVRPLDLQSKQFNDSQVISRYNDVALFVLSKLPNVDVVSLSVGNEVDSYLSSTSKWKEYTEFYRQTNNYLNNRYPSLKVGVKTTFDGLTVYSTSQLKNLNNYSDVILVTYYPLNPDYTVEDPGVVNSDFDTISSLYSGKEIYFLEAGYPSSSTIGSSEAKQAEFIKQVFIAWDEHASQIKLINFEWLYDISSQDLNGYSAVYGNNANLLAYLGSLGLRTYNGVEKPSFVTLKNESSSRGWKY